MQKSIKRKKASQTLPCLSVDGEVTPSDKEERHPGLQSKPQRALGDSQGEEVRAGTKVGDEDRKLRVLRASGFQLNK